MTTQNFDLHGINTLHCSNLQHLSVLKIELIYENGKISDILKCYLRTEYKKVSVMLKLCRKTGREFPYDFCISTGR
jgi:hypothetical protein